MRLDAARPWAGARGAVQGCGDTVGSRGRARGFLKTALEDFIKEFLWVGASKLRGPLGSLRSFSLGKFFSLFNI